MEPGLRRAWRWPERGSQLLILRLFMSLSLSGACVLQRVVDGGQSLERALATEVESFRGNASALKELAFGGCRHYIFLDGIVSKLLAVPIKRKRRLLHFLIVAALYQKEFMQIPDYAVVNETVSCLEGARLGWGRKLVNGALRNFIRDRESIIQSIGSGHVAAGFPQHLYDLIGNDWPDYLARIVAGSNRKPPLTLRVNQRLLSRAGYESRLAQSGIGFVFAADSPVGLTLERPLPVHEIPGFADGQVSVQDESAQLVVAAMALSDGQRVLDGCAAPGGKSGLILESVAGAVDLVAVDLPHRVAAIRENLVRLKLDARVVGADLSQTETWWDGKPFDRILLDVPCSGSGVIRRHPDIKHHRRLSDIEQFAGLQCAMLDSVWPLLAPGGLMLYVTCSIFRAENDQVIGKFVNRRDDYELQSLDEKFGMVTQFGRQRLPGVHAGDGFYYASIRKQRKHSTV